MPTAQPPSASPVASKCRFLPRCLPAPLKCPIEVPTNQIHTSIRRHPSHYRLRVVFSAPVVCSQFPCCLRSDQEPPRQGKSCSAGSPWSGPRVARLLRPLRSRLVLLPLAFPAIGAATAPSAKSVGSPSSSLLPGSHVRFPRRGPSCSPLASPFPLCCVQLDVR